MMFTSVNVERVLGIGRLELRYVQAAYSFFWARAKWIVLQAFGVYENFTMDCQLAPTVAEISVEYSSNEEVFTVQPKAYLPPMQQHGLDVTIGMSSLVLLTDYVGSNAPSKDILFGGALLFRR